MPKRFLFRFSAPCHYHQPLWTAKGAKLGARYRLPNFAELEERANAADLRAAWSEEGIAFSLKVEGKKQPPWCRESRLEDSDGLHLFVDTRDVHNVHRASRFCHHFLFLPSGGGDQGDTPIAQAMPIARARENPRPIETGQLHVRSEKRINGYVLDAMIDAEALTGFDPGEHPRLGFTFALIDRELGEQTFSVGGPMPYQSDPSLWATLELVKS
ncbi:MAG TPA: hypothetical protein VE890_13010 [Thermoguttaceae bacterium]|nr:hypothetical protein [Thermoguttaceae bacterium]